MRETADDILKVRNEKFPVTMKCAGSIFKNLLLRELPAEVAAQVPASAVREGKVPAAWFLEQVGAKGMGAATSTWRLSCQPHLQCRRRDRGRPVGFIRDLKSRVATRFGIEIEEEVQYVGEIK